MWKKIPRFIRNRYSITALVFLTWLLFFENIDLISLFQYRSQLGGLQQEKHMHEQEIDNTKEALYELTSDPEKLEKFAREKYLMKKEGEVMYVIVEKEEE